MKSRRPADLRERFARFKLAEDKARMLLLGRFAAAMWG